MSDNNKAPSVIQPLDILTNEQSLDFSTLTQPNKLDTYKTAEQKLKNTITELESHLVNKGASTIASTISYLASITPSFIKQIVKPIVTPIVTNPKDFQATIHKQAIEKCLNEANTNTKKTENSIQQAQTELTTLKTEFEQTKQAIATILQQLQDLIQKNVTNQEKINDNLAKIKTTEPMLEPAFTKIHFTIQAAKAIDPSLIKQELDPEKQSIETIVLNKDNYVDSAQLFITASKIVQEESAQFFKLHAECQEKESAYHKIKKIHETFKLNLPSTLNDEQIKQADLLGGQLRKSIADYHQVKAQVDKIEAAQKYLKCHNTWSTQTQEDIDTAKLIETKKKENQALNNSMENETTLSDKLTPYTEKLTKTEEAIRNQEAIMLDNQISLKEHQEFADYFKQEAVKISLPLIDETSSTINNNSDTPHFILNPVTEIHPSELHHL